MEQCEDCKFYNGDLFGKCTKHAPVVVQNYAYKKGSDERITLTVFPAAWIPCGDFEKK